MDREALIDAMRTMFESAGRPVYVFGYSTFEPPREFSYQFKLSPSGSVIEEVAMGGEEE